jgi:hypothetical protein
MISVQAKKIYTKIHIYQQLAHMGFHNVPRAETMALLVSSDTYPDNNLERNSKRNFEMLLRLLVVREEVEKKQTSTCLG